MPYFVFVSSQIRLIEIESDESQIDEGEDIEFTALVHSVIFPEHCQYL